MGVEVLETNEDGKVRFVCSGCGDEAWNTYFEPTCTKMVERGLCWSCNYWADFVEGPKPETVIQGRVYTPGNDTSGSFRGMAGRRFDIEYISGPHEGKRITTFDLWAGSEIPERLRDKFPDTAIFLNNATIADASGITCWNPSSTKAEPYPLPASIGIR